MFSNLIESGSHRADLKRKGKFFLGATAFYAFLLAATGVGSIYAYNARIDDTSNDLEVLAIMRFSPEERAEPKRREEPRPAVNNGRDQQYATRVGEISVITPNPRNGIASENAKDVGARVPVRIGTYNSDPSSTGGPAHTNYAADSGPGGSGDGNGPAVTNDATPPPPAHTTPTPAPPRESKPVSLGVITGKAVSKPAPIYPPLAKAAHVQGAVTLQVLVGEDGHVVNAKVTSGHPLLQQAAVQAVMRWRFTPTLLSGQPVKVTGVVTCNFTLQ